MTAFLVTVFFLQVVIALVNTVGVTTINENLWTFYNKYLSPSAAAFQKLEAQQREVVRLKREMSAVSAQDDFARWAKLRRQHDKANADYETNASTMNASKTKFTSTATAVRWSMTNGLRLILLFWYARTPAFWIPKGWLPSYVEWFVALPRSPSGSVSIQIWAMACTSVISLLTETAKAASALRAVSAT